MTRYLRHWMFALTLMPIIGARAQAAAPVSILSVGLEKRSAGTFYINGALKGYGPLDLLVDTGSSLLVINPAILKDLEKVGHAKFSHEIGGAMADGSYRAVRVYRISALRLGAHCWINDIEAAIMPTSARAILGMNVLSRLSPFTFSAEPPQLSLNQCGIAPAGEVLPVTLADQTSQGIAQ